MLRTMRSAPMTRAAAILLAPVLTSTFACSSDTSTSPRTTTSAAGTYALRQVGPNVPAEVHHGPWFDAANHHFYNQIIVTVTGGGIELDELGDFSAWIDIAIVADGEASKGRQQLDGTYKIRGSQVTVYVHGEAQGSLTIENGEIIQTMDLMQEKQAARLPFPKMSC